MRCTNCGKDVTRDVKFCPSCGTLVDFASMENSLAEIDPRVAAIEKVLGNKYRIIKKAGSGGFADVYLGEHVQLGRKVAVKILLRSFAAEPEMIERFRRESKAAAKLSHPNIIDIYDVGESEGIYYFVMKFIEGETLARQLHRTKKLEPGEAIHIVRQLADALAYAHEHNVIHRDIKPANVMIDEFGKPILMDFGIARVQLGGNLTKTGTLMGTPHYLPPEQPLGKPVDGRSDIYSLGIMFFEMLAGKVPFHDDAPIALVYKHINEPAPLLREIAPELAPQLCDIVHRMIEKLPDKRYQQAGEVAEALDGLTPIYPPRATPSSGRRSSGEGGRNTAKLYLLAEQHLKDKKLVQALEIYRTILQRNPEDVQAREKVEQLISQQLNEVQQNLADKDISKAKERLTQLQTIAPNDERLSDLKAQLEREEQLSRKQTQFLEQFQAAQLALKHDNAAGAIDYLTKALTVDPENEQARTLLRTARAAYEKNRAKAEFATIFSEAEYHFQNASYEQALTSVEKALALHQDPKALDLRAKIHAVLKEKEEQADAQIAAQLDQRLKKADVFLRMGQPEKARDECAAILEKNPNHAGAQAKIKQIDGQLQARKMDEDRIREQERVQKELGAKIDASETVQVPSSIVPKTASPSIAQTQPKQESVGAPSAVIQEPPAPKPVVSPTATRPPTSSYRVSQVPEEKPSFMPWVLGGVVVLAVLILGLVIFWPNTPSKKDLPKPPQLVEVKPAPTKPVEHTTVPPPVGEPIAVTIDCQPWANIEISGTNLKNKITDTTPALVKLPPGKYTVHFENPQISGLNVSRTIDVSTDNHNFPYQFQDLLDPEKVADTVIQ